jgi:hypothetical protein
MEFDKSKILTVVTADQAKVGSMGYFSNYIPTLEGYVTGGYNKPDKLERIRLNTVYPFFDGHAHYSLFYPAPKPTYAERQAEWVKENNVKVGTRVHITREFSSEDLSHNCLWNGAMDDTVGREGTVTNIGGKSIGVNVEESSWWYPYFVLEVIKEPAYRPYNDDELNSIVGDALIQKHTGNAMMAIKVCDGGEGKLISLGGSQKRTAQLLLDGWTHRNGVPCGVRVEW